MEYQSLGRRVLTAGAVGFGVLGVAAPGRLARLAGCDEETARELGVRDLANGLLILASPQAGVAQRVFFDLSDAVIFGRRKPALGAGALAFAALGAYTLAAR